MNNSIENSHSFTTHPDELMLGKIYDAIYSASPRYFKRLNDLHLFMTSGYKEDKDDLMGRQTVILQWSQKTEMLPTDVALLLESADGRDFKEMTGTLYEYYYDVRQSRDAHTPNFWQLSSWNVLKLYRGKVIPTEGYENGMTGTGMYKLDIHDMPSTNAQTAVVSRFDFTELQITLEELAKRNNRTFRGTYKESTLFIPNEPQVYGSLPNLVITDPKFCPNPFLGMGEGKVIPLSCDPKSGIGKATFNRSGNPYEVSYNLPVQATLPLAVNNVL